MKIEASFIVHAPRDRVWAAITDPARVAPCIPGCESIEIVGPGRYRARVAVAVGPIKATSNLEVDGTEETALGDDIAEAFRACVEQDEAA